MMSPPSPEAPRDPSDVKKTPTVGHETQWGQLAGVGLQMAVGVVLGLIVGTWLDRKYGWHWGALCGAMLGLSAGMYLLIKDAIRINKD